ncbi:MAG: VOC family protein [Blastocatellia bacterium]|nr:VOC family protein [Blastocatellia bacterium]
MKRLGRALLLYCLFCTAVSATTGAIAPKRPRLQGVAHMAVYVSDVEKARGFYRDFLGYQEPYELKNADGSLSMTFFKVNEDQYIEVSPGLKPGQDRLNHIALQTDDAEGLRAWLTARGVKTPERANKVRIGNTSFNVRDADNHTVEFTQYEPGGWTRREKGRFLSDARISTRILHLGILVGDAPAAMKFYTDELGLTEFWRGAARDSATASWINMRLPESEDYLEFMLYTDLPAGDRRGSQHHICLEVPDIEKAKAKLEANPYRKSYGRALEIRTGINRRRQLNLYDPDGTRIELMEPRTVDGVPPPSTTLPLPRK